MHVRYSQGDNNLLIFRCSQVPDSAILECSDVTDMRGKDFMDPRTDKTIRYEDKSKSDENSRPSKIQKVALKATRF